MRGFKQYLNFGTLLFTTLNIFSQNSINQNTPALILQNNISSQFEVIGQDSVKYFYNSKGLLNYYSQPTTDVIYQNDKKIIKNLTYLVYYKYDPNDNLINELHVRKSAPDSTITNQYHDAKIHNQLTQKSFLKNKFWAVGCWINLVEISAYFILQYSEYSYLLGFHEKNNL